MVYTILPKITQVHKQTTKLMKYLCKWLYLHMELLS